MRRPGVLRGGLVFVGGAYARGAGTWGAALV